MANSPRPGSVTAEATRFRYAWCAAFAVSTWCREFLHKASFVETLGMAAQGCRIKVVFTAFKLQNSLFKGIYALLGEKKSGIVFAYRLCNAAAAVCQNRTPEAAASSGTMPKSSSPGKSKARLRESNAATEASS